MPLLDHFHPPLDERRSWQEFHGQWPAMIVQRLFNELPAGYEAGPHVQLGANFEIDVATFETDDPPPRGNGTAATALAAPKPSLSVETDLATQDEYEIRVYDAKRGRRLVAVIELVSPGNKDRPEHRQAFMSKCLALLQQGVSVSIVDVVTIRAFNFYLDLLRQIGQKDPAMEAESPDLYAVTCRTWPSGRTSRLDSWTYSLALGQPLPRLPLWLSDDLVVWLDLEATYQDTCRVLRIA